MQTNKNGIPVQQKTAQPRRGKVRTKPQFKLGQCTLVTIENGIEIAAVLPNFSPVIKLLKQSGWREEHA